MHFQVDLTLSGFHEILRKKWDSTPRGGCVMYVAVYLGAVRVNEFEISNLDAMWIHIKAGTNTLMTKEIHLIGLLIYIYI